MLITVATVMAVIPMVVTARVMVMAQVMVMVVPAMVTVVPVMAMAVPVTAQVGAVVPVMATVVVRVTAQAGVVPAMVNHNLPLQRRNKRTNWCIAQGCALPVFTGIHLNACHHAKCIDNSVPVFYGHGLCV